MAIPGIPSNFAVQNGNAQAFLSWNIQAGATSYSVQRSTDGVNYSVVATPVVNNYLDTTVTVGTLYYYKVASTNSDGTSPYCTPQQVIPTNTGDVSLGQMRTMAKQRADMLYSKFVSDPEWNTYINQSYFELYDLLITLFEDYYITGPVTLATSGSQMVPLPSDFYKLMGVDGFPASPSSNALVTLQKFDFISRNNYIYPQLSNTLLGVFNPRYRVVGNNLMLIPTPPAGQSMNIWYIPKLTQLLQDTDILVGISGWSEYVLVDAAIKAMQKEESDVTVLMLQKQQLLKRIEDSAMNRDAGQPDTISNTRWNTNTWGMGGYSGPVGGY